MMPLILKDFPQGSSSRIFLIEFPLGLLSSKKENLKEKRFSYSFSSQTNELGSKVKG